MDQPEDLEAEQQPIERGFVQSHEEQIRSPGDLDFDKAREWLDSKWKKLRVCPICENRKWAIPKEAWALPEFFAGGGISMGRSLVVFAVVCTNCGYTHFFNALDAQVLKSK